MQGVTIVDHPSVQHKLTLLRDKETSTRSFRALLREISVLLCYEVTRDLPARRCRYRNPGRGDDGQTSRRKEAGNSSC